MSNDPRKPPHESDIDPEVLERLRDALLHDPVPDHVMEAAEAIFSLRLLDQFDVAELLATREEALVRADPTERLSFETPDLSIELELTDTEIIGQLLPPVAGTVVLEAASGPIQTSSVSTLGVFRLRSYRGPVRLTVTMDHETGQRTVTTQWWVNQAS